MIFAVQRDLEDGFRRQHLDDVDQYAVKVANLYARRRRSSSAKDFLRDLGRLRTAFFRRNSRTDRRVFEKELMARLDAKFDRGVASSHVDPPRATAHRSTRSRQPKRSIRIILEGFKQFTESRNVNHLWRSRSAGRLKPRPEKEAQALFSTYVMGSISNRGGEVLRELPSGTGFVDIVVRLGSVAHLVELKILRGQQLTGPSQLEAYMKSERRQVGWLLVFDVRKPSRKKAVPTRVQTPAGMVNVVCVDVNPTAPSRRK